MGDADMTRSIIFNKIKSCRFDVFNDEEVRNLSVKRITIPESLDQMGEAIENGLYDSALGPNSAFENCKTCFQIYNYCPGHIGHIELSFSVFNYVYFDELVKFLKLICFYCCDLKLKKSEVKTLNKMYVYIEEGNIEKLKRINRKRAKYFISEIIGQRYLCNKDIYPAGEDEISMETNETQKQILKKKLTKKILSKFLKQGKTCKRCAFISPNFAKEGKNKLILKSLKEKEYASNIAKLEEKSVPKIFEKNITKEILPYELMPYLQKVWEKNKNILNAYFSKLNNKNDILDRGPGFFFVNKIMVTPNKFRPINRVGEVLMENEKTSCLSNIMKINAEMCEIKKRIRGFISERDKNGNEKKIESLKLAFRISWSKLIQECSYLYDSSSNEKNFGLKQLLEKKEGILRSNLMGKRVNYAARSVVSPDMWIDSTEIGIPLEFAKKLTFPEPVSDFNLSSLSQMVINGSEIHPGANFFEDEFGSLIDLSCRSESQRKVIAKNLENAQGKRVFRHINNNDVVLMNRQPTLHKASMMGHKVKILRSDHKVLRLHYTNCNTYNADFDGDEINLHLSQNYNAKAECKFIANTNMQYLSPKDASPLRGLVQDHVCAALLMSKRDSFFTKRDYQQYIYITLTEEELLKMGRVKSVPPAILKPKRLWTGKQILSTLLEHVSGDNPPMNLNSKSQVNSECFCEGWMDPFVQSVTIRSNNWITGVCDKTQIGAKHNGIVSAVNELYGNKASDALLTKFGKLFTTYLQNKGLSAGPSDLVLLEESEKKRESKNFELNIKSVKIGEDFSDFAGEKLKSKEKRKMIQNKLLSNSGERLLDHKMKTFLSPITSEIAETVFPHGLKTKFPNNNFSLMVLSGGKGSRVNIAQICALLGQQELEGKRVPRSMAGRTLPSFEAFDLSAEAGGYISQRFLTGINPKVYFFHCMAGREGLVDTAVKTSRSGYLQRCIVKSLENAVVHYDQSVRFLNGGMIQFFYGDDGLDPTKTAYLYNFPFAKANQDVYKSRAIMAQGDRLDFETALKYLEQQKNKGEERGEVMDPVMSRRKTLNPLKHLGCASEKFLQRLDDFIFREYGESGELDGESCDFKLLQLFKFLRSNVEPGEGVGIIAGQSLGEPSTQMTLNTFHLAGHGGANVTLGIPRLREILMTGSSNIKTPTMEFGFVGAPLDKTLGKQAASKLSTIYFSSIIRKTKTAEIESKGKTRRVKLSIDLVQLDEHLIDWNKLMKLIEEEFVVIFTKELRDSFKLTKVKTKDGEEESKGVELIDNIGDEIEKEKGLSEEEVGEEKEVSEFSAEQVSFYEDKVGNDSSEEEINKTKKQEAQKKPKRNVKNVSNGEKNYIEKLIFDEENGRIKIYIRIPAKIRSKLFILQVIESAAKKFKLRYTQNISRCYVVEGERCTRIQTDGVNFAALYRDPQVDPNTIRCNDVAAVLQAYGVEACRRAIIEQTRAVFDVYGIRIDSRHLSLIAEAMTWSGEYRAFNRRGLLKRDSPLLRMSFESGMSQLQSACVAGEKDPLKSHSSKLIMGGVVIAGTGCFDLMHKLR